MKTYDAVSVNENISALKGWNFENNALNKKIVFKNFPEAISFMVRVSFICEAMNHHPEWTNVYNKVSIKLSTHDSGGVTDKDFNLAGEIDKISG